MLTHRGATLVGVTRSGLVVLAAAIVLVGCADGDAQGGLVVDVAAAEERAEPVTAPSTTSPAPSAVPVSTTVPTTTVPATTVPATTTVPAFGAVVQEVSEVELGTSWRPACPVAVEDLRRLDLVHWDGEGNAVNGVLVVHADHADDVVTAFAALFEAGFPIHSMRPITDFDADDDASMRANNTSAFNCREIAGRPGVWSQHAYGGAVDINPLVNPWVRGSRVDPPEGAAYVERDPAVDGLIVAGDAVTRAFADVGWGWGGDWTSTKDYQHFSHNGR